MITTTFSLDFVNSLIGPVAGSWWLGLLADNPVNLSAASVYENLTLLASPPNTGYGLISLASWSWSPSAPTEIVGGVAAYFENTGATTWQTVYGYFVAYRDQASDLKLAWFDGFSASIELPPGDKITFPDGVTFKLRNKR